MDTMLNLIMLKVEIYIFAFFYKKFKYEKTVKNFKIEKTVKIFKIKKTVKNFKIKKTVKNFKIEKTVNLISNYNKLNSSHPPMIQICFFFLLLTQLELNFYSMNPVRVHRSNCKLSLFFFHSV